MTSAKELSKFSISDMDQLNVDAQQSEHPSCSNDIFLVPSSDYAKRPKRSSGGGTSSSGAAFSSDIMADASTVPSVTISLHTLVIMNISEHWTRIRAQMGKECQVYGALIGKQKDRNIEVINSFELKTDVVDEQVVINHEYYLSKEMQYKQVFRDLDFIGWYTTAEQPTEKDLAIHKQISNINECPIMLQLDPSAPSDDQLPLKLYESVIDIVRGEANMLFVPLTYTLATEETERIGVDHVARMATNDSSEKSIVAEHLVAQGSAIKMLKSRIQILLKYIKDIEAGKLTANEEILREMYSLSNRLPVMQGSSSYEEFNIQCNDVGIISYLTLLTKGCNEMNNFVNKFKVLYGRPVSSQRKRGLNC